MAAECVTSEDVHASSSSMVKDLVEIKRSLYPSEDEDEEEEVLSHKVAMERFQDGLTEMILGDPLLSDLPTQVTVEEIQSQIALEYGQAMTVNVKRGDNVNMPVVVVQSASVLDLKNAIKRYTTLKLHREGKKKTISWRYIWKTYWLYFDGQKLSKDHKKLKDYGVRNRDEVTFIKKLKEK